LLKIVKQLVRRAAGMWSLRCLTVTVIVRLGLLKDTLTGVLYVKLLTRRSFLVVWTTLLTVGAMGASHRVKLSSSHPG
jgi:hypothetical protein